MDIKEQEEPRQAPTAVTSNKKLKDNTRSQFFQIAHPMGAFNKAHIGLRYKRFARPPQGIRVTKGRAKIRQSIGLWEEGTALTGPWTTAQRCLPGFFLEGDGEEADDSVVERNPVLRLRLGHSASSPLGTRPFSLSQLRIRPGSQSSTWDSAIQPVLHLGLSHLASPNLGLGHSASPNLGLGLTASPPRGTRPFSLSQLGTRPGSQFLTRDSA
ncbi:Uncharacterized protein Fot_20324 [Forsythia ovata]|uniref:Ribosomal protein L2 n=1 Tax=Forsythia ovata TaxID=205694 RepID=A0ABD1VNN8_9LAMI